MAFFRSKSVQAVLAVFTTAIEDLKAIELTASAEISKIDNEIKQLDSKKAEHVTNATDASTVRNKLEALIETGATS
ncbi:hypothetical protein EVB91_233 [Rhizobium phage RHph_I1_18]|nr:hypothetical protein EVB91_233 [Rhizobium phage RHph_I1_18]